MRWEARARGAILAQSSIGGAAETHVVGTPSKPKMLRRAFWRSCAAPGRHDSELEVKPQAKKEKHFAEDEKRADRQADQAIDKRRLSALPGMADELDNPADHEGADADQQPVARRQPRSPIAEGQRQQ